MAERACACGAPLNEGEAATFTVCDSCWDKAHERRVHKEVGVVRVVRTVRSARCPQPCPTCHALMGMCGCCVAAIAEASEKDASPDWMQEARERCDAATPGPWRRLPDMSVVEAEEDGSLVADTDPTAIQYGTPQASDAATIVAQAHANAEFIAAARDDLPRALDEIERLRQLSEAVQGQAQNLGNCIIERDTLRARVRELESGWSSAVRALAAADALADSARLHSNHDCLCIPKCRDREEHGLPPLRCETCRLRAALDAYVEARRG